MADFHDHSSEHFSDWATNIGGAWVASFAKGAEEAIERFKDQMTILVHQAEVSAYFYDQMPWPWKLHRRFNRWRRGR